ncbi:11663_t:CDS:10 [Funneliformis geosporum]|uniref:15043_t:CDS:1 n=1 Tax=Funneliformis geosporum TaxID=1117311 RepID=A0A9W4SMJ0_9GLOM|nr:11663_t:CDS:10 [Funneliformis geosporum]CAI2173822.1 15043_t:CDS:10 [Funneliformis geosporum]
MNSDRLSTSTSLQSSGSTFILGATSAEELAEKYQKLFLEFSRIKAQHSVLKKAVIKEQSEKNTLQDECKTKEQKLRSSIQQLDLLTFHNQRLTKRIESLQDSGNSRMSPWLLGSAKKELEKSKANLEITSKELSLKIEENEKLHKELFEVNSLYTQHVNVLQTKISDFENKTEELQMELTRSHQASEEALSKMRQEKRDVEVELDQTRAELRITKALMEKNEQKLREGDDALRFELIALRQTLSINLGLADETQSEQFNVSNVRALSENFDSESNEIIASFKKLQSNTREYLNAFKDDPDSSYELSVKVKNASLAWQQNLHIFAVKLAFAQSRITELTSDKELLIKTNENSSNKVAALEKEISALKEELENLTSDGIASEMGQLQNDCSQNLDNEQVHSKPFSAKSSTKLDDGIGNSKLYLNELDESKSKPTSQNDSFQKESNVKGDGTPELVFGEGESEEESDVFVYLPIKEELTVGQDDESNGLCKNCGKSIQDDDNETSNGTARFLALGRNDMSRKTEDDAKQREELIKNNYQFQIKQLNEKVQMADSKAVRFYEGLKIMKAKLIDAENEKSRVDEDISKLQKELDNIKEKLAEEKNAHKTSVDTMTDWIEKLSVKNELLGQYAIPGSSRND